MTLATNLRPQNLEAFVGQAHLVGEGKPLRRAIETRERFSFILWGPPGVGKTTLARIYAAALGAEFLELSAVSAGKADVRAFIERETEMPKVLFLDEIHRFNKAQQDFLLPYVETGEITLIGATTENPSFEVIPALLSRCRVFTLKALTTEEVAEILRRADSELREEALKLLAELSAGDARLALTTLDNVKHLYSEVSKETILETLQSKTLRYDKAGEEHFNTISAFIKSLRASQASAAVYYLARMLEAGEDPKFIARRLIIFASEDIGLAQPTALVVANAAFSAVEKVGLPEASINLAHAVAYLAQAKKDRSAYEALRKAESDVKKHGALSVPLIIRNGVTSLMKKEGYGQGYELYTKEDLFPDTLKGTNYFK